MRKITFPSVHALTFSLESKNHKRTFICQNVYHLYKNNLHRTILAIVGCKSSVAIRYTKRISLQCSWRYFHWSNATDRQLTGLSTMFVGESYSDPITQNRGVGTFDRQKHYQGTEIDYNIDKRISWFFQTCGKILVDEEKLSLRVFHEYLARFLYLQNQNSCVCGSGLKNCPCRKMFVVGFTL